MYIRLAWGLFLEQKTFKLALKQDGTNGEVTAVFATLNVMDSDGDVTMPGAFGQQDVVLSAWGHNWHDLAVGRGSIREVGNEAVLDGHFLMKTFGGEQTYLTVQGLEELQEWSYGYDVKKYAIREPLPGEIPVRWDGMIRSCWRWRSTRYLLSSKARESTRGRHL